MTVPWTRSGVVLRSPRSSAASVVTVPATPIACGRRRAAGSSARTWRAARAAPCGGSSPRKRSVRRTKPMSRLIARDAVRPPTTSSVEPPPTSTTSVPWSSARPAVTPRNVSVGLLVAAQQPRREAVAPLDLAEERLAVLGVANGARRDREDPLGAERLRLAAVVGEARSDARDRDGQEAAAAVDALAEAGDRSAGARSPSTVRPRRRRRAAGSSSSRDRPPRRASLARHVRRHASRPTREHRRSLRASRSISRGRPRGAQRLPTAPHPRRPPRRGGARSRRYGARRRRARRRPRR